jgi:succinate-acetate transporter protein
MADSHQHQFATPLPAGLVALGIACFGLYALFSGRTTHEAGPILVAWFIGGFVVQLVTAIIEFRDKSVAGGNVFLVFACFFMLTGAVSLTSKYFLGAFKMPLDLSVEAWLWLPAGLWLAIMLPCFLKGPSVLFILGVFVELIVVCLIALDFHFAAPFFANLAAWSSLISGILAIYLSGAIAMNAVFGKTVLYVGNPLVGAGPAPAAAVGAAGN